MLYPQQRFIHHKQPKKDSTAHESFSKARFLLKLFSFKMVNVTLSYKKVVEKFFQKS